MLKAGRKEGNGVPDLLSWISWESRWPRWPRWPLGKDKKQDVRIQLDRIENPFLIVVKRRKWHTVGDLSNLNLVLFSPSSQCAINKTVIPMSCLALLFIVLFKFFL